MEDIDCGGGPYPSSGANETASQLALENEVLTPLYKEIRVYLYDGTMIFLHGRVACSWSIDMYYISNPDNKLQIPRKNIKYIEITK